MYKEIKKNLKETNYGDTNPEEISKDAYLNIEKNKDGSVRVNTGIGDHTNLGSGNYTKIPKGEVSRLYNEVIDKAKARKGSLRFKDNFGKEKASDLDNIIDDYNNDLDQDVKDLEPYANRPLKRRELDEITEITGRRDASGSSERQRKYRGDGRYGQLTGAINRLKQTSRDIDDGYNKLTLESDENWEFASADLMERIKRSTARDLDKCATLSEMQTILQSKANTISSYLETGNFKATDVVASFERRGYGRTKDEYTEALNKISELENSGEIDKEDYDKYIKQLQALYNQRRG